MSEIDLSFSGLTRLPMYHLFRISINKHSIFSLPIIYFPLEFEFFLPG